MTESLNLAAIGLLVLVILLCMFWPITSFASEREKTRLDYLMERMDQLLADMRSLNFEHLAGKYLEDEFLNLSSRLEREAEALLVEIIDLQRQKN
jgi:hypothetical protein